VRDAATFQRVVQRPASVSARNGVAEGLRRLGDVGASSQDVALAFGSFAVANAIFFDTRLNQPFSGLFWVPSAPIEKGHCRAGQIA
jgi:hypothetical protein